VKTLSSKPCRENLVGKDVPRGDLLYLRVCIHQHPAGANQVDLEEIREVLERRRADLVERRERLARHTRHRDEPLPPDFAEQAVELENGETLVALDREVHAELREIERALRRLEEGGYGECTECGEPISEQRLAALPYASLCIDCATSLQDSRRG
jgi:RNA polymerase-binding protein DksA